MSQYVPTLSRAGWSKTAEEKIDFLLSDFFTSQNSQSYVYQGTICSLPYLIQHYQGDVTSLVNFTRELLNRYLGAYFDNVVVDVTSDDNPTTNPTNDVTLTIYMQVEQNSTIYSVGKVVQTMNGKINKIVQLNNTGLTN